MYRPRRWAVSEDSPCPILGTRRTVGQAWSCGRISLPHRVRELPVRLPDAQSARGRRSARRARGRVHRGSAASRRTDRRRLRDARAGRPRLRTPGFGRGRCDGVPPPGQASTSNTSRSLTVKSSSWEHMVRALATPGHAPAHNAYVVADRRRDTEEPWLVFTGDSLLVGDVGRPDLHAGGDPEPAARGLYASIERLLELPTTSSSTRATTGFGLRARPLRQSLLEHRFRAAPQLGARALDARASPKHCSSICRPLPQPAGDRRRESPRGRRDADMSAADPARASRERRSVRASRRPERLRRRDGRARASMLPLVGERDFDLASKSAILSFVVAFGIAKALSNLAAGGLADRVGRKRLLVIGWLLALPVPLLIALAPSWGWIVVANLFLGANQGLAWSMTVVMKIDLVGPRRRGLALGLNESAGYLGVALTALRHRRARCHLCAAHARLGSGGGDRRARDRHLDPLRARHGRARRARAARARRRRGRNATLGVRRATSITRHCAPARRRSSTT